MMMLKKLKLKLNNQNNSLLIQRVDNLGLTLIGLISLGYCCFLDKFAELSIRLSFLNFPIFIGEIFLFVCLLLLFFKWKISSQRLTIWGCAILVYTAFILYKASTGYLKWGPLALRHSALFYYPLFAVLGYSFFRKEYFSGKKTLFLIGLFIFILMADTRFLHIIQWDRIACFILSFILIKQQPNNKIRYFLFVILFVCAPYRLFFLGQRTLLVSNVVSMIFLLTTIPLVVKIKKNVVIGFIVLVLMFLYLGATKIFDKNALHSISNLQDNIKEYRRYTANIAMLEPYFKMQPVKQVHVYNTAETVQSRNEQQLFKLDYRETKIRKQLEEQPAGEFNELNKKESLDQRSARSLDELFGNICFRIFIWQDMIADLKAKKPILGFDFGKPFRSKKIEILNMAWGEWSRDGWIAAHNSYLEIIYRSGIAGIILILLIFIVFIKIVLISINNKSILGILLCAILINWFTAANFMLIFELPYYAIPLWSLFGMNLAYLKDFNRK